MKKNWKALLIALILPLAVGGLSALLSGGTALLGDLTKPPLSPPGWLFPIVWTVLYLLMGYATYLIWQSDAPEKQKRRALLLYALQLLANFLWSILFFGAGSLLGALVCLLVLWALIFAAMRAFTVIDERAGDLLLPYILWVSFAAYLNLGFFLLN